MPNAAPISRTLPRTKPTAIIPAPCWSDPCPSNWTSHAPAADNFVLPPCPLVISGVIARKPSPCCWACSVLADRSPPPAMLCTKWGYPTQNQSWKKVAAGFMEELELRNTRPLDPDCLALFFDGKYVEVRDGDRLKPTCIYLVIGLGRDGKKRVLACLAKSGRENLEDWKLILRSLLERGLRRVLIVVHDDFSGLLPITRSLFPGADVQLCVVHMQRNA